MPDTEQEGCAAGIDLSDAVTVFVTTVGAPTFDACMEHLRGQDCRFTLCIIAHDAPMHVAFQRMLDDCRTPYYVQVDEDMLLEPHAVRTLYARIEVAGPRVAMIAGALYDDHLQRSIIGVKIFRHAIVSRYPFAGVDRFEARQVEQFEADGYTVVRAPVGPTPVAGETLGRHGTQWGAASIYERYASLERRRRTEAPKHSWFSAYATEFVQRFQRDPTEQNFFALMGVIAGTLASQHGGAPAKDFRTYDSLPGFAALQAFLTAIEAARPGKSAGDPSVADGRAPERRAPNGECGHRARRPT